MKPSSLAWVRLNSVPVIAAARPAIVRRFVAAQVGHTGNLKSLDDLESNVLHNLNQQFTTQSNEQLETQFLEFLKGK